LGQQVIVENRRGGAGIIAIDAAAKAVRDGYTMLVYNNGCGYSRSSRSCHTIRGGLLAGRGNRQHAEPVGGASVAAVRSARN